MSTTTLSITEARNNLLDLIRKTKDLMERVIITKNGKPEAVLISYDEYESWLETLEITQDSNLMKEIAKAKEDIKAGRLFSYEEVLKSLKKKKAAHK
ncbi:MAG: hypothetical protein A3D10_04185 [Omnitrophica WOR_2 bacterium RIFCSPHIGHO2_02_FULL_48_11]|nr:MAG: hypothetical protein A3D10_04185 [Omnitrophica WOR_2 bacterium RIFCSPHIGHO2_02_FULL_48_11]